MHLAHLHELGNDLGSGLLQAGSQLADGDLIGDGDFQLRVAGLLQLDALQSLSLGLTAAAKLLAAAVVAVVELFFLASGLVLALVGHVAAVGQVVVAGVELIHVHVDGAGVNRHLGTVDLHLLHSLDRLLDAGVGGQLLQGNALFAALLGRLVLGLAVLLALRLFLFRILGFGLLFLGLRGGLLLRLLGLGSGLLVLNGGLRGRGGLFLDAAGQVGIQAALGILASQGLQQQIQFLFTKGAAGLVALAGNGGYGLDHFLGGYAELLGNISDLVFKIHRLWSSLSGKMFCAQLRKVFVGNAEHGGGFRGKHSQLGAGQRDLLTGNDALAGFLHMLDGAFAGVSRQ